MNCSFLTNGNGAGRPLVFPYLRVKAELEEPSRAQGWFYSESPAWSCLHWRLEELDEEWVCFPGRDEWFVCCCWLCLAVQEVGRGLGGNLVPGCCHLRILATSILGLLLCKCFLSTKWSWLSWRLSGKASSLPPLLPLITPCVMPGSEPGSCVSQEFSGLLL